MHPTTSNGLDAANDQPVKTLTQNTKDLNSATGARRSKEIATLTAKLALAGHAVHQLQCGDFSVCKYGYTFYAQDFDALQGFAERLGVLK